MSIKERPRFLFSFGKKRREKVVDVLNRRVELCSKLMDAWLLLSQIAKAYKAPGANRAMLEASLLKAKADASRNHAKLLSVIKGDFTCAEDMKEVMLKAPSLEILNGQSELAIRQFEREWNQAYVALNEVLGSLENKRRRAEAGEKVSLEVAELPLPKGTAVAQERKEPKPKPKPARSTSVRDSGATKTCGQCGQEYLWHAASPRELTPLEQMICAKEGLSLERTKKVTCPYCRTESLMQEPQQATPLPPRRPRPSTTPSSTVRGTDGQCASCGRSVDAFQPGTTSVQAIIKGGRRCASCGVFSCSLCARKAASQHGQNYFTCPSCGTVWPS